MSLQILDDGFVFIGCGFILLNILQLFRDREVTVITWGGLIFFVLWGAWNAHYYPNNLAGGVAIAIANLAWLALRIYYRCKGYEKINAPPNHGGAKK